LERRKKNCGSKEQQQALNAQWQSEKDIITKIQTLKKRSTVNIEIQQAERDYDLNRQLS